MQDKTGKKKQKFMPPTTPKMQNNNCRMYETKYPAVDDIVVVHVKKVDQLGAYVNLLEYDNIEGMILLSELSRRRIRSINKLIRVGRTEIVVVLRVDPDKGYIDLSKRRVTAEDIPKCEERFNRSKAVHSIMRHVSETCQVRLESLYEKFGWDLYKRFGHGYDAFKLIVQQPEKVLDQYKLEDDIKKALLTNINRRLMPQPVRIRADVEVTCFSYEGIDAIKASLRKGEALSDDDMNIKITLVAPPLFVIKTTTLHKEAGIQRLKQVCQVIKETLEAKGGNFTIKEAPRAICERDDKLLSQMMEKLEAQNREVPGDDE